MLTASTFAAVLTAATELDPYGKRLSKETISMAYLTLADEVKQQITDEMFIYAFKQHRMDPAPDKELSIEQQILQHLYRCENGVPNFRWGLRKDLPTRMTASNTFHGQTKSPYQLGEDLGRNEPRFAPGGVLSRLAALPGSNALGSDVPGRDGALER